MDHVLGQAADVVDGILGQRGDVEPQRQRQLGSAGSDELPPGRAGSLVAALGLLDLVGVGHLQAVRIELDVDLLAAVELGRQVFPQLDQLGLGQGGLAHAAASCGATITNFS